MTDLRELIAQMQQIKTRMTLFEKNVAPLLDSKLNKCQCDELNLRLNQFQDLSCSFEELQSKIGSLDTDEDQAPTNTPAQRQPHPIAGRSNAYWRGRSSGEAGARCADPGPSTNPSNLKRDRLVDTISPRGEHKRQRTDRQTNTRGTDAHATQPHLSVAITLSTRSDMTQIEASSVQSQVQKQIFATCSTKPEPGTSPYAPAFVGKALLNEGVLKLWCHDEQALSWLQEVVPRLKSPREGTGLMLIKQADKPIRVKSALYVPDFDEGIANLQQVLSLQNPWYKVSSWTLYTFKRTTSTPPGLFLVLGIPTEQLDELLSRGRRVAYSTGSIYIRFFDGEGLSDVPPRYTPEPEITMETDTTTTGTTPGPSVDTVLEEIQAVL
ncbi:jg17343, partial [Pararge aegeria aegeria]